ncbi:FISUMP domain-containing protein [Sphingobacterium lactis]|uniref:Major paralogous domain-containing protein n=1 Tax=Sphingobacterium lactis TaxID=797291 RepID=A0A1H5UFK6_9SPHI|nr:FISUMP domain-containing protein [Sphingobacterium lactis]SEF73141.1 major paralogous domain-containing protein [Sphingobacterium lactis]
MLRFSNLSPTFYSLIIVLFCCSVISCKDTGREGTKKGEALVMVRLSEAVYADEGMLGQRSSSPIDPGAARQTITLNSDYLLQASLIPIGSIASKGQPISAGNPLRAAVVKTPLTPNIRYKLVVFKSNGEYVAERDYVYTQESHTPELLLDGGTAYTFIAYSINSTTALPNLSYRDGTKRTLDEAIVSTAGSELELMYFRKDMTVTGNNPNHLAIILRHRVSEITTTIDAQQTGYNITTLLASLTPHYPTASMNLADGTIVHSGTPEELDLTFSGLPAMVATAAPVLFNTDGSSASLTLGSIDITHIAMSNVKALSGMHVLPGFRYNLKLTIVPNDGYLSHADLPAVRIGGQIWMRHNVGAIAENPEQIPITSEQHGNYHQWGRMVSFGDGTSNIPARSLRIQPPPPNWSGIAFNVKNAWNTGTDTEPEKNTDNDPCPTGYRVPTKIEMKELLTNVLITNTGTWTEGASNYDSGKVFTSKRKSSVTMVFPAQGMYNSGGTTTDGTNAMNAYIFAGLSSRGSNGLYWLSNFRSSNTVSRLSLVRDGNFIVDKVPNNSNTTISYVVRCIAENQP